MTTMTSAEETTTTATATATPRKTSANAPGKTLLKVSGLKVGYGGIQAVKGVDFEVRQGELVTLIGSNGAGKTTTMKAITGLLPANASRALEIADRAYVMESGIISMSGDAKALLDDPKVRAAYLGE